MLALRSPAALLLLTGAGLLAACGAGSADGTGGSVGSGGDGTTSAQGTGGAGQTTSTGFDATSTGQGGGIICTPGGPDDDVDQDGFTPNTGDCEDCDPARNPNAIEVQTKEGDTPYDENCDDVIDEIYDPQPCDAELALDEMDPIVAVQALELCKLSTGPLDWGLVSGKWVLADGSDPPADPSTAQKYHLGHGILTGFGPNIDVRKGDRMLALSSGTARQLDDPGYQNVGGYGKGFTSGHPQGFPKESPACPGITTGTPNDSAGVELVVRTPSNATGFSFDFDFYTYEWPGFVCSQYNDFFVALLTPFPEGQTDGNITYDTDGNPISVNNALLEVCGCPGNPPGTCTAGGKIFTCSFGNIELIGTGFGFDTSFGQDHGATSWLRTTAPVDGGGEITVRFTTYDSGDGALDSTSLIDNFQWLLEPGTTVGTNPVPE